VEEEESEERIALADVTPQRSGCVVSLGPRDSGAVDLQYREPDLEWLPKRQTL
jgi:hypothetical protein